MNEQIVLASRPKGKPGLDNFRLEKVEEVPPLKEGQVRLKPSHFSVDPYLRGRMNEEKSYIEPFVLNEPIVSGGVAEVIETLNPNLKKGDIVTGLLPWKKECVVNGEGVMGVSPQLKGKESLALGLLGMPGLTAYHGLFNIGQPKKGEHILVSGACGAVGSTVCQMAKIHGLKVTGIAGTSKKIKYLKEELGIDNALNYKDSDFKNQFEGVMEEGLDIFFDNVGGEILDMAMDKINLRARIIICGAISQYNLEKEDLATRKNIAILKQRAKMEGFVIMDHLDQSAVAFPKMVQWMKDGLLKNTETQVKGFSKLPQSFLGLFKGENIGKFYVTL
jgi:NADPH-dependent curcumin reductase CurA